MSRVKELPKAHRPTTIRLQGHPRLSMEVSARITHDGSQILRHALFLAVDDTLFDRCSRRHCSDVPLEDR